MQACVYTLQGLQVTCNMQGLQVMCVHVQAFASKCVNKIYKQSTISGCVYTIRDIRWILFYTEYVYPNRDVQVCRLYECLYLVVVDVY